MQEQIVTFKTAKLAKEGGFDEQCNNGFYESKERYIEDVRNHGDDIKIEANPPRPLPHSIGRIFNYERYLCEAPTQSLLQKWLREEHNIYLLLTPRTLGTSSIVWHTCNVLTYDGLILNGQNFADPKKTYEEALEEGLKLALKLIK